MNRLSLFNKTLEELKIVFENKTAGWYIAQQLISILEYLKKISEGDKQDLTKLKKLAEGELPYRDIDMLGDELAELIYKVHKEIKKMYKEIDRKSVV